VKPKPKAAASATVLQKQQILRETYLFGLNHRIYEGLRARTPFEEFSNSVAEAFKAAYPEIDAPDGRTLRHLYERAFDASSDQWWFRAVKGIARSIAWKNHQRWLGEVIKLAGILAGTLDTVDARLVRSRDVRWARSLSKSIERFRLRMVETHGFDKRLDDVAKLRNEKALLRQTRIGMNRTLLRNCPKLNAGQRVELIRLSTELATLKIVDTTDAVARQLHRHKAKK
jgi:hypothetical protein